MFPNDPKVTPAPTALTPNPRNNATMFKIFQNVQYNVVQHKKYVKEMINLYNKLNKDEFRISFKNALHYLFTFGDANANIDRVIQFVATFSISLDEEEEFLLFIFEIIFDCQCVSGQSVRYRASQLLAVVLKALGEEASLDDELCDKLLRSQLQRLQDTRGAVRCRAALALQRLQIPTEADDEVTRAYQFHMSCDPSASVRRAIVMSIARSMRNVPFVLERLCDIDEGVRRAAFLYVASISVTQLRVKQRVLILKVGLTQRSPRVRRVVEEILVPGWLSTFQGNIIDLLKAIRLDNARDAKDSQLVAGKLLESLFKHLPMSELLEWLPTDKRLRLIPSPKLNKETAWYWRHLAEYLQTTDDDETLETILPDLVVLIGYIRVIVETPCPSEKDDPIGFSTRQYVLHELGCMLKVYDASDPAGRTALQTLITDILTGDYGPLEPDVIKAYVYALEMVVPDVTRRIEVISGVLTALRDVPDNDVISPPPPPRPVESDEVKVQKVKLRVSLNVAMEAQNEAVKKQDYTLAAECKAKVEEIQRRIESLNKPLEPPTPPPKRLVSIKEKASDEETLTKCLIILNCALDTDQLKSITPMLQMIFNELEVDIFKNPTITEHALQTVALYGMLDKNFIKENKAFFFTNLIETLLDEKIVTTALRCIIDLLIVHGVRVFEDKSDTLNPNDSTANAGNKKQYCHIDDVDIEGDLSESAISVLPAYNTVIQILLNFLDSACAAYRLTVVEGLCRLLYLEHIESPAILSRLLLLWFNPATVDEDDLRQTIGVFFLSFPCTVEGAQEQIQKATLPTLRTLANAPSSSPLSEIDQEAVVKFIVSLTKINQEVSDSQDGMAMILCQHIVRKPTSAEVGLACRILALLSPPTDPHLASELATMLRDLRVKLPDKQSCRNLSKYLGALEAFELSSLNKVSTNTGMGESTMPEDTIVSIGRITTSLPRPIARSTNIIMEESEKNIEIDETSPTEIMSRISEEAPTEPGEGSTSMRESSGSDNVQLQKDNTQSDSSEDVSPFKKAKVTKGKNKKSGKSKSLDSDTNKVRKGKGKSAESKQKKTKVKETGKTAENEKGVKRSRSQRSLVDVERARKAQESSKNQTPPTPQSPSSPTDNDFSNVTVRRPSRSTQSSSDSTGSKKGRKKKGKDIPSTTRVTRSSTGSSRNSAGSSRNSMADNFDDTSLHTIVYDKEFEPEILNDSSELANNEPARKGNVTIPETPDDSEVSHSESDPE